MVSKSLEITSNSQLFKIKYQAIKKYIFLYLIFFCIYKLFLPIEFIINIEANIICEFIKTWERVFNYCNASEHYQKIKRKIK